MERSVSRRKKIPLAEPSFGGNEWRYMKECLDSGWVSSAGKYVSLFEEKIAAFCGSPFAVSTVNGTSALHTALRLAGVGVGDPVLVPTLTFIATVNPVLYCGARPVFIDAEEETLNMDPAQAADMVRRLIKKKRKPKAVIVAHLYGRPADLAPLLEIARQVQLTIIEDACESLGSRYKGRMTGTVGDIGCLSFNGNKIITTGGGGMLLMGNARLARRARYLTTQARDHDSEYIHKEVGYNYRLTNLQAALGVAQLERLGLILKKKKWVAREYAWHFANVPQVKFLYQTEWGENNFWLNTLLFRENRSRRFRASFIQKLKEKGIETRPIFFPLHLQPPFQRFSSRKLPVAENCSGINLPSSFEITQEEICFVAESVKEILS